MESQKGEAGQQAHLTAFAVAYKPLRAFAMQEYSASMMVFIMRVRWPSILVLWSLWHTRVVAMAFVTSGCLASQLIKALEAARGNGTSMISLIMPPKDQVSGRCGPLSKNHGSIVIATMLSPIFWCK